MEARLKYFLLAIALMAVPSGGQESGPQAQSELKRLIGIVWKKGPDLPQGFQDSDGGIIGNTLITVGGFCGGKQNVPGKPDRYPRGFLKKVWGLDLSDPKASWVDLPDFPGAARQELSCIVVAQELYCWGGFSYFAPFTYHDGYRLSRQQSRWVWEPLPDLPSPACSSGICAIGSKIYLFGGADYDHAKFYTHGDRSGRNPRLGSRMLAIDTRDLKSGWKRLADCPGTPRWVAGMAAVGNQIFVIGGGTGNDNAKHPGSYQTAVDNWSYNPSKNEWKRIRDLPVASGNFPSGQIVFKDRYIVLIGGYQYAKVENPDGSLRDPYGAVIGQLTEAKLLH